MTLTVIGAGLGRTGTMSLKLALDALGFGPCYHMSEVFRHPNAPAQWDRAAHGGPDEWDDIFAGYRSAVDWPASGFYETLAARYPEAKVILTRRDPDAWFRSVQDTIFDGLLEQVTGSTEHWARMVKAIVVDTFDGRLHDRDHVIGVYEAHNARVRRTIAPGRLLDFDVAQGWGPLCAFLGCPVPEGPFPRSNSTDEFRIRRAAQAAKGS